MPRPLSVLLVSLILAACPSPKPADGAIEAVPRLDGPAETAPTGARVLGVLDLRARHARFGGLSGMAFDGDRVVAVNDSGHWISFVLDSDDEGRPLSVRDLRVAPLGGLDGSKQDGDAEELVGIPGGWLVSFERRHRVLSYGYDLSGEPARLDVPPEIADLPDNGGIEAMALLPDGRLFMVAEEGERDATLPAWVGAPGAWQTLSYRRQPPYRPTAAAGLPDGGILVVERRFSLAGGIGARLVRLSANALRPGAVVEPREILVLDPPLPVDNFEGVSIRRRDDGRILATLISDDNFNPLQSTLLMVVLLPDREGGAP